VEADEQSDGLTRYRIERGSDGVWKLVGFHFGAWHPLYSFRMEPRRAEDFVRRCREQEHESPWCERAICQRATEDGLVFYEGERLRWIRGGRVVDEPLGDDAARLEALRLVFGVAVPHVRGRGGDARVPQGAPDGDALSPGTPGSLGRDPHAHGRPSDARAAGRTG
jgi:arylamine N-acetyltransferase